MEGGMRQNRLLCIVSAMQQLIEKGRLEEQQRLERAQELIAFLVERDDWLPDELSKANNNSYQQNLLYGDPLGRFSLVSFVWGPGQKTPIHNHEVWGVVGVLRGAEVEQSYKLGGTSSNELIKFGNEVTLEEGDVSVVSSASTDYHMVRNKFDDRTSVSIHLYGGNIGRVSRSFFDKTSSSVKPFISNYSNKFVPNLWHCG